MTETSRHMFLVPRYYGFLKEIQAVRKRVSQFIPVLNVEDLETESKRQRAAELVAKVNERHAHRIEELVQEGREKEITDFMSDDLKKEIWTFWSHANYF